MCTYDIIKIRTDAKKVKMSGFWGFLGIPLPLFVEKLTTVRLKKSPIASVCSKTSLIITGGVGAAREDPLSCKMETFFQIPLELNMPICKNVQLNGASGETLKL